MKIRDHKNIHLILMTKTIIQIIIFYRSYKEIMAFRTFERTKLKTNKNNKIIRPISMHITEPVVHDTHDIQ